MDVDALIDELVEREGGFVNHPADDGGATNYGITEAVARANGYSGAMREMPRAEAVAIYKRLYWLRPRFDQVAKRSEPVAAELFDTGVNMGPAVAVTFLQRALSALNRDRKDYGNYILEKAMPETLEPYGRDRPAITREMRERVVFLLEEAGLIDHPTPADEVLAERLCRAVLVRYQSSEKSL